MAHMTQASDELTSKVIGPCAIIRTCRLCGHTVSRRRGGGRGAGFREGNKQRGVMHAHIKDTHPKALQETFNILAADGWQSAPPPLPLEYLKTKDATK